jgi:hypothetical protein
MCQWAKQFPSRSIIDGRALIVREMWRGAAEVKPMIGATSAAVSSI